MNLNDVRIFFKCLLLWLFIFVIFGINLNYISILSTPIILICYWQYQNNCWFWFFWCCYASIIYENYHETALVYHNDVLNSNTQRIHLLLTHVKHMGRKWCILLTFSSNQDIHFSCIIFLKNKSAESGSGLLIYD